MTSCERRRDALKEQPKRSGGARGLAVLTGALLAVLLAPSVAYAQEWKLNYQGTAGHQATSNYTTATPSTLNVSTSFRWNATEYADVESDGEVTVLQYSLTAGGGDNLTESSNPAADSSCTYAPLANSSPAISIRPDAPGADVSVSMPTAFGSQLSVSGSGNCVNNVAVPLWNLSNGFEPLNLCWQLPTNQFPPDPAFLGSQLVSNVPDDGQPHAYTWSESQHDNGSVDSNCAGNETGSLQRSINATLTATSGQAPPTLQAPPNTPPPGQVAPPPVAGPTIPPLVRKAKDFATQQLGPARMAVLLECGQFAKSTKGFAEALASAASPGPVAAGWAAVAGAAYSASGNQNTLQGDPLGGLRESGTNCAMAIVWLVRAQRTAADPPDAAVMRVALPVAIKSHKPRSVCSGVPRRHRAICTRISTDRTATGWALAQVAATYDAISTTMNRLANADAAGSTTGQTLQSAALAALHGELGARLGALQRAERALARELRHDLGRSRLSAADSAQISSFTDRWLGRPGISQAQLAALPKAPARLDEIAGRDVDFGAAGATAIGRQMTLGDLQVLTSKLARGKPATRLLHDLTVAEHASSTGKRRAALRAFARDVGTATPSAELLRRAAELLGA